MQIIFSVGSPARYVFYFDQENSRVTDLYFNPILVGDKYIAYMEDGELILTDIFQMGLLKKKISRDFSKTANPSSPILNIKMINDEMIELEYLAGENYIDIVETIFIHE